jgi:hypothetical protein
MMAWDLWKKGFDAWEDATARYAEQALRSPAVLTPAGSMFTAMMKTKAATDKLADAWWSAWGLPTRRDQERSLHALNQIQSRLSDLEEKLVDLESKKH